MQAITTIGLDIAKSVFQVHGVERVTLSLTTRRPQSRAWFSQHGAFPARRYAAADRAYEGDQTLRHEP